MRILNESFSMRQRRAAFTLVELIISIAMVLILMTGIVKVFKYATDAVGAGLAVSDIVRAQRATQITIPFDTGELANNYQTCPAILLDSQQNDPTGAQTPPNSYFGGRLFLDKNDQTANPAGSQQFRLDTFSFFTGGAFTRQTGNDGTYMSSLSSTFAWIWYGHIWLPDNSANFHPTGSGDSTSTYPGYGTAATNPNNFYARQWILGRMAMLVKALNYPLTPPATDISSGNELEANITLQANGTTPYPPSYGSTSRDPNNSTATVFQVQQSRYDLLSVPATSTGNPFKDYYDWALNSAKVNTPQTFTAGQPPHAPGYITTATQQWWYPINPASPPSAPYNGLMLNYRFQSNPYPVRSTATSNQPALSSAQMAVTSPAFVDGCVRFYVEYAGDFINQKADGTINTAGANSNGTWNIFMASAAAPYSGDGTDFYVDVSGVRHIRWYGLPRSVAGGVPSTLGVGSTATSTVQTADVLPLAYYLGTPVAPFNAPFEAWPTLGNWPATVNALNRYICAWDATPINNQNNLQPAAPSTACQLARPTMFRITLEVIDPNGQLSSPRVFQYILPVQSQ